jgi:glycoprotein endo-alpha-1,2-mannosidase
MRRVLVLVLLGLALPAPAPAFASASADRVRSAIFFYPWYSNPAHDGGYAHWQQGDHAPPLDVASAFYPARGAYSSGSPRVLAAQMREIRGAGVDEVVSSWWGRDSTEDARLRAIRRAARAHGLRLAVHVEPYAGRSPESIRSDLEYLRKLRIRDVYVYRATDFSVDDWLSLNLALDGMRVFAQTDQVGFAAEGGFAGFYTYDVLVYGGAKFGRLCAEAHVAGIMCAPSVGPGFDASLVTGERRIKAREDGATYDHMWHAALEARADVVTITSYNEWSEGTQIEPACDRGGYESYDGAYGVHGHAAAWAYLDRTAYWTSLLAPSRF